MDRPTLFLLHALGGSVRAWRDVEAGLGERCECVALDLPGFGDRSGEGHVDVAGMVAGLIGEIAARRPAHWFLVGHSMGGKIATLVAARTRQDGAELAGLAGVILLAASPPSPEPMAEERRAEMVGWFRDGPPSEDQAAYFVDANTAARLPDQLREMAIADVRRSSPAAWTGWLEHGAREDWSRAAGILATPALIVAGAEDGDLGEAAQRRLNLPHYPLARVERVDGAAHLLPLERPDAVAALIAGFVDRA